MTERSNIHQFKFGLQHYLSKNMAFYPRFQTFYVFTGLEQILVQDASSKQ